MFFCFFYEYICIFQYFVVPLQPIIVVVMLTEEPQIQSPWELNPVWDVLSAEEKEQTGGAFRLIHIRKNQEIYCEGDEPTHINMLVSGKVRIHKEGVGQRQIIRLLKPYDFFGFRAVIMGEKHHSSASALEDCTIYQLERGTFMQLVKHNNEFCYRMMVMIASHLASAETQTVNLTQKHIRGRLAESLLTLKERYGMDEDGVTIAMYMSREDLANMSSMTTANAIRTLSQFASEGVISVDGRKIKLLDEEEIKRISRLG